MKSGIHPEMKLVIAKCACGAEHKIYTVSDTVKLDVCSECHPFYQGLTGSQIIDTEGRVQRFKNKYKNFLKD
ncbi:MAG TPA: 50S ribosomal protein L31 [Tepiditoga sp.]|nr:50S ribosomal protein L31 [Thermotogota bacterium]HOO74000.1 50S ribosomal protein L31 [Tepiditoga sp.]